MKLGKIHHVQTFPLLLSPRARAASLPESASPLLIGVPQMLATSSKVNRLTYISKAIAILITALICLTSLEVTKAQRLDKRDLNRTKVSTLLKGHKNTSAQTVEIIVTLSGPKSGPLYAFLNKSGVRVRREMKQLRTFSLSLPSGMIADRKSTRLNSSHSQISYAVFCLKKK